jgi:hypothetical protein
VEGGRIAKPTLLIVGEGETELGYFKDLKRRFRASWMIAIKSDKPEPRGVLECAEREARRLRKKGLDVEAWIVIDAESAVDEKRRCYREVLQGAASKHIGTANSSPCFEYWPLLHFSPGIKVYTPAEAVAELERKDRIPGYSKPALPYERLWQVYLDGVPSKAAHDRRAELSQLGEDPLLGRPVTYVDVLVDRIVEIASTR